MLLWNTCPRVRNDPTLTDTQKADFALKAWVESVAIEEALNEHTCNGEKSTLYHASFIFSMWISFFEDLLTLASFLIFHRLGNLSSSELHPF